MWQTEKVHLRIGRKTNCLQNSHRKETKTAATTPHFTHTGFSSPVCWELLPEYTLCWCYQPPRKYLHVSYCKSLPLQIIPQFVPNTGKSHWHGITLQTKLFCKFRNRIGIPISTNKEYSTLCIQCIQKIVNLPGKLLCGNLRLYTFRGGYTFLQFV